MGLSGLVHNLFFSDFLGILHNKSNVLLQVGGGYHFHPRFGIMCEISARKYIVFTPFCGLSRIRERNFNFDHAKGAASV